MGRPLWVDDPSFNLGYHVRHTALPAPGASSSCGCWSGRIFSQRLDRSKPLWELWIVEGFEERQVRDRQQDPPRAGGRRVGGRPDDRAVRPGEGGHGRGPARPRLEPRARAQRRRPRGEGRRRAGRDARSASPAGRSAPRRARAGPWPRAREAAAGVGEVLWGTVNSAPKTPLNGPIGPHRRVTWARIPLAELKEIKNELGGTVNDVFLATVDRARCSRWLQLARGRAPRAWSCARPCRSRCAPRVTARHWATRSR